MHVRSHENSSLRQGQDLGLLRNHHGSSLAELLVAVAISTFAAIAIFSMMEAHRKESAALSEKMAAVEIHMALISAMANSQLCTFETTDSSQSSNRSGQSFDDAALTSSNKPSISFKELHLVPDAAAPKLLVTGERVSPLSSTLIVNKIALTNITSSGTINKYNAEFVVSFDNTKTVRALKPVSAKIMLVTKSTGSVQTIEKCQRPSTVMTALDCNPQILDCGMGKKFPVPSAKNGEALNLDLCTNGVLTVTTDYAYSIQPVCDKGIWKNFTCNAIASSSNRNCEINFTGELSGESLTTQDIGEVAHWKKTGGGTFLPGSYCKGGSLTWTASSTGSATGDPEAVCRATILENIYSPGYAITAVSTETNTDGSARFRCSQGTWHAINSPSCSFINPPIAAQETSSPKSFGRISSKLFSSLHAFNESLKVRSLK